MKKALEDMTGEEQYKELCSVFAYLPDYETHPIQFAWHVRLYKYYRARQERYGKSLQRSA